MICTRRSLALAVVLWMAVSAHAEVENTEVNPVESSPSPSAASPNTLQAGIRHQAYVNSLTDLGRKLFRDKSLSGSGKQSCASCHDPNHAFASPNNNPIQYGGKNMKQPGTRAVPSLRYIQTAPTFTEHYFEDEGPRSGDDNGPTGGRTWDGRANTLFDQARIPLLAPNEMANTPASLVESLRKASYSEDFRKLFGNDVFEHPETTIEKALLALETYQQNSQEFFPYSSKFDDVLRGKARFTAQELRGFKLFADPDKGNCASCHSAQNSTPGAFPQFTDYGYAALGLPRNFAIPANRNAAYFDMGLCGPSRADLSSQTKYCGFFKVPSLRNVARRRTFFHNGKVRSLAEAVRFYSERDTRPEKWFPKDAKGRAIKFNDLPGNLRTNVEDKAPFGERKGNVPVLSDQEIKDIVAFLKTLTDKDLEQVAVGSASRH